METYISGQSAAEANPIIIQRLSRAGVPDEYLKPAGLVQLLKNNNQYRVNDLVLAIMSSDNDDDVLNYQDCIIWLKWLMFHKNIGTCLSIKRVACRKVWGKDMRVYGCRTCGIDDETSLVCLHCFFFGDHEGHDTFFLTTSSVSICHCGETSPWKRAVFCSCHQAGTCMHPLPDDMALSAGPVLDILLIHWKEKLLCAAAAPKTDLQMKAAHGFTTLLIDMSVMLFTICESFIPFLSQKVSVSPGLLEVLLMAERFMNDQVTMELHKFLLRLLAEPSFTYEFTKAFVVYYPTVVDAVIEQGGSDTAPDEYPLLSTFSVHIFTAQTLTLRLVEEMDLLGVLLQSLSNIFASCAQEDGRLKVAKWMSFRETTSCVVHDIRCVMSHSDVAKYVCLNRKGLVKQMIGLLACMQGIQFQKREDGLGNIKENHMLRSSFILLHSLSGIFYLLVAGAFSGSGNACQDKDGPRHVQVLSQGISTGSVAGQRVLSRETGALVDPSVSSALWLIYECLLSLKCWLEVGDTIWPFAPAACFLHKECKGSLSAIGCDDTSRVMSVHIPLHRALSIVLLRSLKDCCDESESSHLIRSISADGSFPEYGDFIGQILEGCNYDPDSFSASVMEHPLRIRVFCAEVRAGMWRGDGDVPKLLMQGYRSVPWNGLGQELDIFLLQICAALTPPDFFVLRILQRFGLSDYLSLNLEPCSEHEPVLVAEMLTLLIQIVKERRFCGLTSVECLQRELVSELSTGAPTRSQLEDSLPVDLLETNQLGQVLGRVAHSTGQQMGMYELRPSYWKELDLYHPGWNSKDRKIAVRRYSRFCKASAITTQLPKWTQIYYPLKEIAKVATCESVLEIIRAVLFYAVFTDKLMTPARSPDDVLFTALHLLALSLDVCQVHKESGDLSSCYVGDVIPLLAFASEKICTSKYGDHSMLSLLVLLLTMREKESSDHNSMEAAGINCSLSISLIRRVIKSLVEIEPRLMSELQKLAPELPDKLLHSTALDGNFNYTIDSELDSDLEKHIQKKSVKLSLSAAAPIMSSVPLLSGKKRSNEEWELLERVVKMNIARGKEARNSVAINQPLPEGVRAGPMP